MKKALLALICMITVAQVQAQVRLGFIAGPSFSTQKITSNSYSLGVIRTRLQYHIGALAGVALAEQWSLQPELLFSYQGSVLEQEGLLSTYNKYNLGYLKLPVALTYVHDLEKAYLIVGGGPYLSRLINNSYTYRQNNENAVSGSQRIGNTTNDQITPWDYGIRFKAGFEVKKGIGATFFYDYGTQDVNPQMVRTNNRVFGLSLFYMFKLNDNDRYNRYPDYYNY
jgi:hypothetical protein